MTTEGTITKVTKEEYDKAAVHAEVAYGGETESIDARCCLVAAIVADDVSISLVGAVSRKDLLNLAYSVINHVDFTMEKIAEIAYEDHE